ncbi:MAG: hypothetical protein ACYDDF_00840 [Thermoplasmatota archaeon]
MNPPSQSKLPPVNDDADLIVPQALMPYVAKASQKVTARAFMLRLAEIRTAFDGLLDDETLAHLLLDELGLNDGAFVTLTQARDRVEASVEARVAGPPQRRSFTRKDGRTGEVLNVPIQDATAASMRASLVLWDRDIEKAANLVPGKPVKIINARVKNGTFGLELHASAWTVLEVPGAPSAAKAKLLADVAPDPVVGALAGAVAGTAAPPSSPFPQAPPRTLTPLAPNLTKIQGRLEAVAPTRATAQSDGRVTFETEASLATADGPIRVLLRDAGVKAIRAIAIGSEVRIDPVRGDAQGYRADAAAHIDVVPPPSRPQAPPPAGQPGNPKP